MSVRMDVCLSVLALSQTGNLTIMCPVCHPVVLGVGCRHTVSLGCKWVDGRMDGQTDGRMGGWMNKQME